MRLATMNLNEWQEYAKYVDTLCLPIYSISIQDKQIDMEHGRTLERVVSVLERRLTGRILLLPTISYIGQNQEAFLSYLNEIIKMMNQSGFYHLILVTDQQHTFLCEDVKTQDPNQLLQVFCHVCKFGQDLSDEVIERETDILFQNVLQMWQNQS